MKRFLRFDFWTVQTLGWGIFALTNFAIRLAEDGFAEARFLAIPLVFGMGMLTTGLYRRYIHLRRWHTKSLRQILLRTLWSVPVMAFMFAFLVLLPGFLAAPPGTPGAFSMKSMMSSWLSSCIIFFGWTGLYFAYHFFIRYREAQVLGWKTQALLHESRLQALKSQVNPHFLFNSLNSLSALIDIDTVRAKKFVDDLAASYRYLLQANDQPLVALSTEIDFLKSYFNLLKTRHGEGVQLNIDLPADLPDLQIPALTLQLLVENAVKHNSVSASKPLKIRILSEKNEALVVTNNVQKKSGTVQSTKTGLVNIVEKYRLLGKPTVEILDTPEEFRVRVPLI